MNTAFFHKKSAGVLANKQLAMYSRKGVYAPYMLAVAVPGMGAFAQAIIR